MATMLGTIWQYLYTFYLRFWFKWILRQITGKCELQRICHGYKPGAGRTTRIENSLNSSKNKVLQEGVSVKEDAVEACVTQIIKVKNINEQKDPKFKVNLQQCLIQISGYNLLFTTVEELRKEVFNSENIKHEKMLLQELNLRRNYETKHQEKLKNLNAEQKIQKVEELKKNLTFQQTFFTTAKSQSEAGVKAEEKSESRYLLRESF
ncbi:ELMO domain-containing protein 2 precursor [Silurus meridionalis]|nr:ELMO domain-containing protein 2 precursor [Silurus meridionalis]